MALREQLDQLAAALQEIAKAEGADALKAASEAAQRIMDRARALADELADELPARPERPPTAADKGLGEVEKAIRDKPWVAVSLAAAAGFLLAALVRR